MPYSTTHAPGTASSPNYARRQTVAVSGLCATGLVIGGLVASCTPEQNSAATKPNKYVSAAWVHATEVASMLTGKCVTYSGSAATRLGSGDTILNDAATYVPGKQAPEETRSAALMMHLPVTAEGMPETTICVTTDPSGEHDSWLGVLGHVPVQFLPDNTPFVQ